MSRSLPICPARPGNARSWSGFDDQSYSIDVVTPMFGGGVERCPEIIEDITPDIDIITTAWFSFGGRGARTSRGCGSIFAASQTLGKYRRAVFHRLHGSPVGAIVVYDPRLRAAVVASHRPKFYDGQIMDVPSLSSEGKSA